MSADTQIKSFFQRWERLEGEKKAISDDLKELFSEAKHAGYDSKALRAAFNRKVKQDAETTADQQFDMVVDTYLDAINGVARDTRMRARENIEKFDPETGEILEDINPRLAKQVVDGMETEAGRAALIAAVDILIEQEEAEEEFQAKASGDNGATVQDIDDTADSVTGDASRSSRGDDSPAPNSKTDAAISRPGIASLGRPEIENRSDKEAPEAGASGGMQDEIAIHPADPIDPSEDREEGHSLDGEKNSADANAGGGHVNAQSEAAQRAGALVKPAPAHKPLRPLCRNPGEHCGGYGSTHCASCIRASKQTEVAA